MTTLTRHELFFQARMNIRYHEILEGWYGNFLNWTSFVSLLLSSAAFAAMTDILSVDWQPVKTGLVAGLALFAAILNGAVLAFGMLGKLGIHSDLKRQWIEFLSHLQNANDTQLNDIEREFHTLNAREPAANEWQLKRAYNKTCESLGLKSAAPVH